ncbi:Rrf2 family transcriptional regulator [Nocardia yamanashiensis]|uniref:Rrf2 family transcriptional regulator n=1 Tax=Nocardia yamanashiensis TaxID=209247 RepID=UPI003F767AD2
MNASENYVAKAVSRLSELGYVAAQRGRTGGLFLTEQGRTTTVGRIVRALEGDTEVIECARDRRRGGPAPDHAALR